MIIIEGNIGSGKTMLGKRLEAELGIVLYKELSNSTTNKILKLFYEDKKKWAFLLQIHFLNERFRMLMEAQADQKNLSVFDRGLRGDLIFASTLYEDQQMSSYEYSIYVDLFKTMLQFVQVPTLLIYLRSSVPMLQKRIKERSRGNEHLIGAEYLQRLNIKYDAWYNSYSLSKKIMIDKDEIDWNSALDIEKTLRIVKKNLT